MLSVKSFLGDFNGVDRDGELTRQRGEQRVARLRVHGARGRRHRAQVKAQGRAQYHSLFLSHGIIQEPKVSIFNVKFISINIPCASMGTIEQL